MEYRELCWESFARKDHFSYFSSMQNPYVGVTVETDIGELPRLCRETGTPFFSDRSVCREPRGERRAAVEAAHCKRTSR